LTGKLQPVFLKAQVQLLLHPLPVGRAAAPQQGQSPKKRNRSRSGSPPSSRKRGRRASNSGGGGGGGGRPKAKTRQPVIKMLAGQRDKADKDAQGRRICFGFNLGSCRSKAGAGAVTCSPTTGALATTR